MSQETSNYDSTPEEIWLASSGNETASPFTEALADFDGATKAQYTAFRVLMRGEGASVEEDQHETESLIVNSAQSFARLAIVILEDEDLTPEQSAEQISWLFYSSRQKRIEFFHTLAESAIFEPNDLEEITVAICSVLAGEYDAPGDDDIEVKLEHAYGSVCAQDVTEMITHISQNKIEVQKMRRGARKTLVLKSLGEIAKIGAGAAIALVANRFIKQK